MTIGSLFSGIGGLELGLERGIGEGCRTVWQVEQDEYCRAVLAKHWPNAKRYEDVRNVGRETLESVDIICGGFPCQDISLAGQHAGLDGERSGLWSEYARIVRELRPFYIVVENVSALLARGFGRVLGELAEDGYDAEWDCLPAGYFGAPHFRERVFLLAYPHEKHGQTRLGVKQDRTRPLFAGRDCQGFPIWLQAASGPYRMDDGVPARLYRDRVGALGNSVVPEVSEHIGRLIAEREKELRQSA